MRLFVLIVDDEFGLADVIAKILTEEGYDTSVAMNGRQALVRLHERRADVVLLDTMMPEMDGPETLAAMRATPVLADVPVIMMTALPTSLREVDRSLYQGVLYKPFSLPQLFGALKDLGLQP